MLPSHHVAEPTTSAASPLKRCNSHKSGSNKPSRNETLAVCLLGKDVREDAEDGRGEVRRRAHLVGLVQVLQESNTQTTALVPHRAAPSSMLESISARQRAEEEQHSVRWIPSGTPGEAAQQSASRGLEARGEASRGAKRQRSYDQLKPAGQSIFTHVGEGVLEGVEPQLRRARNQQRQHL